MKKITKIYSVFVLIMTMTLCLNSAQAQDSITQDDAKVEQKAQKKSEKKAEKEKKKEERKAEEQEQHDQAMSGMLSKEFTLEATQAYDRRGAVVNVQSDLNFVQVSGDRAVVQLAFPQLIGFNGVGGITVDGNISNYKIKKDEKHDRLTVSFHVQGPTLMADVSIELDGEGNWANSSVEGDFSAAELNFRGNVYPNGKSDAYEGTTRY